MVCFPKPQSDVFCFKLNFKIPKLSHVILLLLNKKYCFRELVPIISTLEYNDWFTKVTCDSFKLVCDSLV